MKDHKDELQLELQRHKDQELTRRQVHDQIQKSLESLRQSQFAQEQRRESVVTRPIESIVDVDSV